MATAVPPPPPLPIRPADLIQNQTLFLYHLNTKVKVPILKSLLYEYFSPYGKILDVVVSKFSFRRARVAFVVFAELTSASLAFRKCQGQTFIGKPLCIDYAKTKSDKVAILDGTFKMRRKEVTHPILQETLTSVTDVNFAVVATPPSNGPIFTLFVENLPSIMNEGALSVLFYQYPGFLAARVVSGRNIGFVDFATDYQAELAMQGLNGFLVTPEHAIKVSLAKKDETENAVE